MRLLLIALCSAISFAQTEDRRKLVEVEYEYVPYVVTSNDYECPPIYERITTVSGCQAAADYLLPGQNLQVTTHSDANDPVGCWFYGSEGNYDVVYLNSDGTETNTRTLRNIVCKHADGYKVENGCENTWDYDVNRNANDYDPNKEEGCIHYAKRMGLVFQNEFSYSSSSNCRGCVTDGTEVAFNTNDNPSCNNDFESVCMSKAVVKPEPTGTAICPEQFPYAFTEAITYGTMDLCCSAPLVDGKCVGEAFDYCYHNSYLVTFAEGEAMGTGNTVSLDILLRKDHLADNEEVSGGANVYVGKVCQDYQTPSGTERCPASHPYSFTQTSRGHDMCCDQPTSGNTCDGWVQYCGGSTCQDYNFGGTYFAPNSKVYDVRDCLFRRHTGNRRYCVKEAVQNLITTYDNSPGVWQNNAGRHLDRLMNVFKRRRFPGRVALWKRMQARFDAFMIDNAH